MDSLFHVPTVTVEEPLLSPLTIQTTAIYIRLKKLEEQIAVTLMEFQDAVAGLIANDILKGEQRG